MRAASMELSDIDTAEYVLYRALVYQVVAQMVEVSEGALVLISLGHLEYI